MIYGPPLEFKGVNRATGEEYSQDDFVHYDTGLYHLELNIDDEDVDYELYQATGFKDAKNKAVFYGDVVMSLNNSQLWVVCLDSCDYSMTILKPLGEDTELTKLPISFLSACAVVGNHHMTTEQLKAAAEEMVAKP